MLRTLLKTVRLNLMSGQQKRTLFATLDSIGGKKPSVRSLHASKEYQTDPFRTIIFSRNAWNSYRCFYSRLSWFTPMNKQEPIENDLVAKKEKALHKALKNKFEQELETLEKIQNYHFDMLKNWTADTEVVKIQSPRFNEIKEKIFQIHQDQIERTQEAIDVKRLLIIQNEKQTVSKLLRDLEEVMKLEALYHKDQVHAIKESITDFSGMLLDIGIAYRKDPDDKNFQLIKSFVKKHKTQLEEQIQRHEEILKRYDKFLQCNITDSVTETDDTTK